jgi:hypothetical protein
MMFQKIAFLSFFSTFILASSPNLLSAQTPAPPLMTFEINALANEIPTSYVATWHVSQVAPSPEEAERLSNARIRAIQQELQKLEQVSLSTEFVSLQPIYKTIYGKPKKGEQPPAIGEQVSGFDYRQNIYITYSYSSQLSKISLVTAKHNVFELLHNEASYNKSAAVFQNLRAKCFEYMRQQLPLFEDQGIDVLDWERYLVEERKVYYPNTLRENFSSQISQENKNALPADGLPLLEIRPATSTFDTRLPLELFHIVVNAELPRPTMQFVYTMKIQMIIPTEQQKIEVKNEIVMPAAAARPTFTPLPPVAPPTENN